MSASICSQLGRISISCAAAADRLHQAARLVERALARREARHRVGEDVGARHASRRSIARAQTSSAWVESRPPETPITTLSMPLAAGAAPAPTPGCCRPRRSARRAAPGRPARRESAPLRAAAPAASRSAAAARRRRGESLRARSCAAATDWPKVFCRMRSRETRSRSTSAVIRCEPSTKRSDCASSSPFSQISAWPSQARSVVDSPAPAEA